MKKSIIALCAVLMSGIFSLRAQTSLTIPGTYFIYPTPPASAVSFYDKCTYMVYHFWDHCDMKSAFSSNEKLRGAFQDFLDFAVHANLDTTMMSVNNLIKSVEKTTPKNLLTLGKIAQRELYSDSAKYYSEQLYYPFAKAVADNKKIPEADRQSFARQAKYLGASQEGMQAPDFAFTRPDGSKGKFSDLTGKRILMVFAPENNHDTRMLLVRLSANINLNQLHNKNYIDMVVVYPQKPNEAWKASVADYPEWWNVIASPEAAELYNQEIQPVIVYITDSGKILSKSLDKNGVIEMLAILNSQIPNPSDQNNKTEEAGE